MDHGISITVSAPTIPELANKLGLMAAQFGAIATTMAAPNDADVTGETEGLIDAPESRVVTAAEARANLNSPAAVPHGAGAGAASGAPAAAAGLVADAEDIRPKTRGVKGAKAKTPTPAAPKDRFFDDPPEEAIAGATPSPAAKSAAKHYVDDLSTEDAYIALRARAKLIVDADGIDVLKQFWLDNWATIVPESQTVAEDDPLRTPGLKHIEGKREPILRALAIFDEHHGIDQVTGEQKADVVGDLL